jgi:hypothetical protein
MVINLPTLCFFAGSKCQQVAMTEFDRTVGEPAGLGNGLVACLVESAEAERLSRQRLGAQFLGSR